MPLGPVRRRIGPGRAEEEGTIERRALLANPVRSVAAGAARAVH